MGLKIKNTISKLIYPNNDKYMVRFIDYDGTILKEQWVLSGDDATPPNVKNTTYHYFFGWNIPYTNIQYDLDVAAIRNTIDNNSYIFLSFTIVTDKSPILYINKSDASLMTIEWGDGNITYSYKTGDLNFPHTYSDYSDRIIKVSTFGNYTFGNGTSSTTILGNNPYKDCLIKLYLSNYIISLNNYMCYDCNSLLEISMSSNLIIIGDNVFTFAGNIKSLNIPNSVNTIGNEAFYEARSAICITISNNVTSLGHSTYNATSIKNTNISTSINFIGSGSYINCIFLSYIYLPSNITVIGIEAFAGCVLLKKITIQEGVTTIYSTAFKSCYNLASIILPSTLTSIADLAFQNCSNLQKYVFYSTTPPSLAATTVFTGIVSITKIYVPDESVAAYKTATNWITYANYIYPISQIPV